jgi:hypothetical protein
MKFTSLIWDLALLAGCSYIVFWRGHSAWWFLLAVALMLFPDSDEGEKT